MNTFGKVAWVILLSVLFVLTGTASADRIKCGDKLRVTLNDGRRFTGQFSAKTADSICILNGPYQWSESY